MSPKDPRVKSLVGSLRSYEEVVKTFRIWGLLNEK